MDSPAFNKQSVTTADSAYDTDGGRDEIEIEGDQSHMLSSRVQRARDERVQRTRTVFVDTVLGPAVWSVRRVL